MTPNAVATSVRTWDRVTWAKRAEEVRVWSVDGAKAVADTAKERRKMQVDFILAWLEMRKSQID